MKGTLGFKHVGFEYLGLKEGARACGLAHEESPEALVLEQKPPGEMRLRPKP